MGTVQHVEHHDLPKRETNAKKKSCFHIFNNIICKLLLALPILLRAQNCCKYHMKMHTQTDTSASITSCPGSTHLTKTRSNLNKIRFAFHLLQTVEHCSKHCKLQCFGSVLAVSKAEGGSWGGGYIYIYMYILYTNTIHISSLHLRAASSRHQTTAPGAAAKLQHLRVQGSCVGEKPG